MKPCSTGTLISAADHAENLANLILSQVYITVGADEEDCTALAGPVGLWPFGGMNLGDNAVSPRLMNANMGNDRMFRYALRQPAGSTSKNGISVTFKRSEHMSLTYSTDTTISTGAVAVAYAAHVVAFGRRVLTPLVLLLSALTDALVQLMPLSRWEEALFNRMADGSQWIDAGPKRHSPGDIIERQVCRSCGSFDWLVTEGKGPHAAGLRCTGCDANGGWLPKAEVAA